MPISLSHCYLLRSIGEASMTMFTSPLLSLRRSLALPSWI